MKTVYLKVDEEVVDGAGKVVGAQGTTSTDILVEFSPDWEPLSKYATTRDAKGLHPEVIVITELMKEPIGEEEEERFAYRFTLSGNATCEEGLMSITFTGYEIEEGNETETLTNTALAKLRVLPSDYAEMDDGSVTPTIAQQLQSEIDEIKDDISIATHAQEYAEAAEGSASDAAGSAESAEGFASNAEDYATLSRSYARGDTDSRQGEETDNAKYYKELAEQYAGVFVVEDNLESTSATHSLSANQGRVLDGKITDILSSIGEPEGIASLDATGRIPYTQLPESAMEYQGTWDASTNTPTLTQGVGDSGDFYVVSTAGTWSGITFNVNDRVIYDGDQELWVRLGAGEVISVNNKSGVVLLNADDIPFDPTGSTLLSTNTEDAIKEAARVGGGMVAKFNITSDAGSTVTVTMPSGTTVTAQQKTGSTTEWEANTAEYGTHTLTATLNGQTATTTVVVDTCKVYMVAVAQFSATITVTYPTGATCTCVGTSESYTATTNPQVFTVHSADTFTITATDGTHTKTETVVITTDGQSESVTLSFVPDGSTVTPTDDIQTWLACASIDEAYTTLADVLADSDVLVALMADDNACDYLVRSTTWATGISTDETAMQAIGASDYCSDTLLADSTWCSAICNSAYFEDVLNAKSPNMTGYTTPSGEVSASYEYEGRHAWWAFDGQTPVIATGEHYWFCQTSTNNLNYTFDNALTLYKVELTVVHGLTAQTGSQIKFQSSLDNSTWTDEYVWTYGSQTGTLEDIEWVIKTTKTKYYRFYVANSVGSGVAFGKIHLYGRQNGGVQTWLHEADITDKDYTTLAEVLADSTTLSALMASQDAVDYLVTCKGWANTICADQTAMSYIGLNNYCANTLLADSTWCNAIANSPYIESVMNVKVPTMTSNTTPSGSVISSSTNTQYPTWKCFDGDDSTPGACYGGSGQWIGYEFPNSVSIKIARIKVSNASSFNIQAYVNNDWETIAQGDITTGHSSASYVVNGSYSSNKYRIICVTLHEASNFGADTIQFYGREDL